MNLTSEHQAFSDRLDQLIALFPSSAAFARATDLNPAYIAHWRKRGCQPLSFTVMKICFLLGVDANWLLLGRGTAPEALPGVRDV